jgi:hypothetical protein
MKLDSTNTFLTVVSLAMFSVTSVLVGLLVCAPGEIPPECNPDLLDIQCPEGSICNELGRCVSNVVPDETELPECEPGQRTSTCRCPDRYVEHDGVCDEPPSGEACEHADVADLLARLEQACTSDRETAPGRLEACPPTTLRDVILGSHRDTLKIARVFREHSFTLHFAQGTPAERASGRWPSSAEQPRVVSAVHKLLAGIEPRGYLLLVALASATGTRELNYKLAVRRSDAAVVLVEKARQAFPDLDQRLADMQLLVGLVGHEERAALDLETFDAVWGATGRYRAWNESESRHMRAALDAWRGGSISATELQWLTRVVNQSVLVIPLPCRPADRKAHG